MGLLSLLRPRPASRVGPAGCSGLRPLRSARRPRSVGGVRGGLVPLCCRGLSPLLTLSGREGRAPGGDDKTAAQGQRAKAPTAGARARTSGTDRAAGGHPRRGAEGGEGRARFMSEN